ncbi:MAG: competence/damage-inducible protein A [Candidatus Scalindua sp.]|nr:competence/damage-inducible protein A [Candidatus Scalindua sp.]
MTKVIIISVGSEIVSGHIKDLNAPFIASRLSASGFHILSQMIAGDIPEALQSTIQAALHKADVIVITGGLGSTMDDITRETVADVCNAKLRLDKISHTHLKQVTNNTHITKYVNNIKQAMIPDGGTAIPNFSGIATGFLIHSHNTDIICLPGVHSEMKRMVEEWVLPYLLSKSGKRKNQCVRVMKTFGMSESALELKLRGIIEPNENLSFSTLVNDGVVSIRIESMETEIEGALSILDDTVELIRKELQEIVFGHDEEMLEDVVSRIFKECDLTLSVAESCTGGLVSDLLTNIQGSSKFFLDGIVSYSNRSKSHFLNIPEKIIEEFGAVSAEVAIAMAYGIRESSLSDVGLAVTGIAGPTVIEEGMDRDKPVGLVYVAMVTNDNAEYNEYHFSGSRVDIKKRAANAALNMLRLKACGENNQSRQNT